MTDWHIIASEESVKELAERVAKLEQEIRPFEQMLVPNMTAREIIMVWFSKVGMLNPTLLYHLVRGSDYSEEALRMALFYMKKKGVVERVHGTLSLYKLTPIGEQQRPFVVEQLLQRQNPHTQPDEH